MSYNFLGGQGYLTEEDRKKELEHGINHLTFKTCIDASKKIEVSKFHGGEISFEQYSHELALFINWWTNHIYKDLNGFHGFAKFEAINFKIII